MAGAGEGTSLLFCSQCQSRKESSIKIAYTTAPAIIVLSMLAACVAPGTQTGGDSAAVTEATPTKTATTVASAPAASQVLANNKNWEVGDKATFKWTMNGKAQTMEDEIVQINDTHQVITNRAGGKTWQTIGTKDGTTWSQFVCISNGQPCTSDPAATFFAFPLEKGKKWTTQFTVKGETFTSNVTQERVVDRVEKIKLANKEFTAYRINFIGKINGTDNQGKPFSGKEDGSDWLAVVSEEGKVGLIKTVYRNSFGEKASRELVTINVK